MNRFYILCLVCMLLQAMAGFGQEALTIIGDADGPKVGICTTQPTETLEVNGNLKVNGELMDSLGGIIMPVGTILPYGGTTAPPGWILCDGRELSREEHARLFTVIGTAFGGGNLSTTYNVPDLRGMFLRGMDSGAGRDPNAGSRTAMRTGGNSGNNVGSYEGDAFQGHVHSGIIQNAGPSWYFSTADTSWWANRGNTGSPVSDGSNGSPRTSSETRPKNVYVNYIIKY